MVTIDKLKCDLGRNKRDSSSAKTDDEEMISDLRDEVREREKEIILGQKSLREEKVAQEKVEEDLRR
jgi:hypothetical protein